MKAQEILDALRSAPKQDLLDTLAREHRTNQQLLADNVFAIIGHWSRAYETGAWDARNASTVRVAHDMIQGTDDIHLPYI
jgi:hypothetical protein